MTRTLPRRAWVALAVAAQGVIVAVAMAAPLSARLTGQEYLLRVAPVDPVDPFRGAYVALSYPDLPTPGGPNGDQGGGGRGEVFVPLVADGDVWRGTAAVRTKPAGPALRCHDEGWRLRCGIESWFLPQAEAAAVGRAVADGTAVAVVRIDDRGNAALVALRTTGAGVSP